MKYPEVLDILKVLSEKYVVKAFNANELAFEAGNRLAMNVKALVPQKTIEVNLRAFEMGRQKVEES
jgi:indolepyruvate ferredoxin oxidoreductase beta subunit